MAQKVGKKKKDGQTKKSVVIKTLIKMEEALKSYLKAGLSATGAFLARRMSEARENKIGLLNLFVSLIILSKVNLILDTLGAMIDGLNNAFTIVIIQLQQMGIELGSGIESLLRLFTGDAS